MTRSGALYPERMKTQIPTDYITGYEKAQAVDAELASAYVAHTQVGDPGADAVVQDLGLLSRDDSARLINAALEQDEDGLRAAPESLKTFIARLETPPDWFDFDATLPGCNVFYKNWYAFTASLVGAGLIEGFSTGISKSFMYTGRLLEGDQGLRRLKQNNRHQAEIFLPDGLRRYGEGWKLTVRIRLVHAQIRRLLSNAEGWKTGEWGVPVSAAHLALANAVFSGRVLLHVQRLKFTRISAEERQSFMLIWRYTGYLMGVPETLLCTGEEEALHLFDVGSLCEPPPTGESVAMANALINAGPGMAELSDKQAKKLLRKIYRVSRALIGDTLADQLCYPKLNTWQALRLFAAQQALGAVISRIFGAGTADSFMFMLQHSQYDKEGISYLLPDNAAAELSNKW